MVWIRRPKIFDSPWQADGIVKKYQQYNVNTFEKQITHSTKKKMRETQMKGNYMENDRKDTMYAKW